jgi:alpha-glucosidase
VEAVCRRYIRLRYELLPYLYTQFRRAAEDGTPVLRPVAFHYPQDPEAWAISDQALVGEDLLVCPITRPGATRRAVCFPEGDWYDIWTGARFQGPDWRVARADLATLPLFVRAGAVLPRSEWGASTALQKRDVLILEVYPGPELRGEWYDDDGSSFAYRDGAFSLWRFSGGPDEEDLRLTLTQVAAGFDSPEKRVRVVVRGVGRAEGVTQGGRDVPWEIRDGNLSAEGPLERSEWIFRGL